MPVAMSTARWPLKQRHPVAVVFWDGQFALSFIKRMATQPQEFPKDAGYEEEAIIDFTAYVRAIQRAWRLIVAATVVGGALAFGYAHVQPLRYEGVTTLLVVPPSQGGAQVNPATFRAIVDNQSLASEVINELKLPQITPHKFLERALAVDEIRGTNIVKVRVTLGDPRLAAEASRRLAQKAILLAQQITQQDGASVQAQLKRYLGEATQRMQQAERELLEYKQRAQVDLVKRDAEAELKERADLLPLVIAIEGERARLATAENEIKRQQPVLQMGRAPAAEEALRRIQSAANPSPETDKAKEKDKGKPDPRNDPAQGEVDAQQLDLTNPFVNPVYQTLDFQIATSRIRIARLEREREEVMNVKKLGGKELSRLNELYRGEIEQARLQASYDLATKVHSELALRYEQSRTLPVGNTSQLQIVDQALPPDNPVARKRVPTAMLGAGIGFIGMALIALLWESRARMR